MRFTKKMHDFAKQLHKENPHFSYGECLAIAKKQTKRKGLIQMVFEFVDMINTGKNSHEAPGQKESPKKETKLEKWQRAIKEKLSYQSKVCGSRKATVSKKEKQLSFLKKWIDFDKVADFRKETMDIWNAQKNLSL